MVVESRLWNRLFFSGKFRTDQVLDNTITPELVSGWPQNKRLYKRAFELLRCACVEARYSPQYEIKAEELEWLFERIEDLQNRVRHICQAI